MQARPSLAMNFSARPIVKDEPTSRRTSLRVDAVGYDAVLLVGPMRIPFHLIDLSEKGVSGKADIVPDIGSRVTFEMPGEEPRRATVRWKEGDSLGIELDLPIDPERILRSKTLAKSGSRRLEPRYALKCPAQLKAGWSKMPIKLINVSSKGLRAEAPFLLRPGMLAQISTDFYEEMRGQVRWCRDGLIGVQLDTPLDVAAFMQRVNSRKT